jgi:hypothetical protein
MFIQQIGVKQEKSLPHPLQINQISAFAPSVTAQSRSLAWPELQGVSLISVHLLHAAVAKSRQAFRLRRKWSGAFRFPGRRRQGRLALGLVVSGLRPEEWRATYRNDVGVSVDVNPFPGASATPFASRRACHPEGPNDVGAHRDRSTLAPYYPGRGLGRKRS